MPEKKIQVQVQVRPSSYFLLLSHEITSASAESPSPFRWVLLAERWAGRNYRLA